MNTSASPLQYETTANTLAFSLFCLATHPEAEAKMVAEIRALAAQETAARAAAAAEGVPHQAWYSKDLDQQVSREAPHPAVLQLVLCGV